MSSPILSFRLNSLSYRYLVPVGDESSSLETIEGGTILMKVQLVVVRGKPEGKVIPLVGPNFKIGRGETCHLRPNSEQVSREHAEFTISGEAVVVRDLGSRNGTLVNGKALTAEACRLKDRDLVQVGPLTFAVAILDARRGGRQGSAVARASKPTSPDDVSGDDIDSWLVGPNSAVSGRSAHGRVRRRHDHDQRLQRCRLGSAEGGTGHGSTRFGLR